MTADARLPGARLLACLCAWSSPRMMPADSGVVVGEWVSREEISESTGIAFMEINTLYQLLGLRSRCTAALEAAHTLLMMPDLFTYWLSGSRGNELYDRVDIPMLRHAPEALRGRSPGKLGLPTHLIGGIVPPGTVVGELMPHVVDETGVPRLPVVAAGGHDTALAVAAVPTKGHDFAYLSSGTWSLLGTELQEPCINARSLAANFTNEAGVYGTKRFLKNVCGLWIVQGCRRAWARPDGLDSYDELMRLRLPATRRSFSSSACAHRRPAPRPTASVPRRARAGHRPPSAASRLPLGSIGAPPRARRSRPARGRRSP